MKSFKIANEMSQNFTSHYIDTIMGAIASQIISLTIVYSIVYSGADQRKHRNSPSLAFVQGISPHKWPVMRKKLPFDDVIMTLSVNIISDDALDHCKTTMTHINDDI